MMMTDCLLSSPSSSSSSSDSWLFDGLGTIDWLKRPFLSSLPKQFGLPDGWMNQNDDHGRTRRRRTETRSTVIRDRRVLRRRGRTKTPTFVDCCDFWQCFLCSCCSCRWRGQSNNQLINRHEQCCVKKFRLIMSLKWICVLTDSWPTDWTTDRWPTDWTDDVTKGKSRKVESKW